ncbi:unnamed protein product [Hydatigera taeniaeformis]|uniref:Ovule protein n=1 Tax=Hydatigena taeniaeformis TaxID=6205 RepID=A0A0R3WVS3_HYDTA|nr:unnamed protein product [Hydatigera taeniaeformis]
MFAVPVNNVSSLLIMNSSYSPRSIDPQKPLSIKVDEQNTKVQIPYLPPSPSMIDRARPGRAVLVNSTLDSVPPIISSPLPSSSLMRFINSSVFSVIHTLHYLDDSSASEYRSCLVFNLKLSMDL